MRKKKNSPIFVTESDYNQLTELIKRQGDTEAADNLDEELSRADIIAKGKSRKNVVCLNSTVTYRDNDNNAETRVTVVMPQDANIEQAKVSVLSPVGSALIGLKKNGYIEWPLPNGAIKRLTIVEIEHPEDE
ncbi:MAG: nucleoside diphosphate kinase regulator [Spongiibacteraceae bacterium]